jgi:ribosomal protein L31
LHPTLQGFIAWETQGSALHVMFTKRHQPTSTDISPICHPFIIIAELLSK